MTTPLQRLRAGLMILGIICVVAAYGFWLLGPEEATLLDAIYMVVVTLSTVGYKEVYPSTPEMQMFTILVIVFGVSAALHILGGFVQMMAEGEINRALGHRRMQKDIDRLSDHVVICGFGRMGETIAGELSLRKTPFVIIESDAERIEEAVALNYLELADDSTEEDALIHAGVARAKTLVTTLPRDADNVFITLTARNLNPNIMIIARGEFRSTEKKLLQAGADRVVLPATTGALRMAAMITRPSAVELIEVVAGRHIAEVEVDEVLIPQGSPLVGVTVRESETRRRHGLLIVALRSPATPENPTGQLQFNPGGDAKFEAGGALITMGRPEDIDRFREEHNI